MVARYDHSGLGSLRVDCASRVGRLMFARVSLGTMDSTYSGHIPGRNMTTSRRHSEEQPFSKIRRPNVEEALKLINHWLETDDRDDDTSEWETLKKLLDEDRLSERKFYPHE